ncbi:nuclear transport factor 2 family protein [Flagellimonas algicola]|uniref:Nuclear transport factor 2 family protein n=1 Tax=Flagellimonas algicola TaxID=2583815 RepID=A0ABY2WK99_9FLAO|nr:nuclear transport factor 2 family protein [Allomuricauda algicola]TMU54844.1 nuclear transport factor 2 family protein [Allomuricauda algicola]
MRIVLLLFTLSLTFSGYSQTGIEQFQNEIDMTVWKPFKKAFETLDGEELNAIYAEEVLRVTPQGIDTENVFKAKNLKRFKTNKAEGVSIALDFWFDSRHTNEATSYEVGFYRIGFTSKDETNYSYGQFHIVLKKINGHWKITQDWDTTHINGNPITASDFAKKAALKF